MESYIFWTCLLALAGLVAAGLFLFGRAYLDGASPTAFLFRPKGERRLEVVDHANVDGRRKLVLIRRDDVEHLVMTGGPVDVVIETGISGSARAAVAPPVEASREPPPIRRATIFGRDKAAAADPVPEPPNF